MKPVIVQMDDNGEWYVFPKEMLNKWNDLHERMNSENSNIYEKACIAFDQYFEEYKSKNGDINNIQLYADID